MRSLTLALVAALALAGCNKKGESAKLRDVYHCWEMGWQAVERCSTHHLGDCAAWAEDWFESNKTGVTVLDSNAAFASDKAKCARTTGISAWNTLAAEDMSDDMAEALLELQAGVKKQDLAAIRSARSKVRALLDLAP